MKRFVSIAPAAVLVVAAGFNAARSADSATETDEKAIRSLIAQLAEDWNKHNISPASRLRKPGWESWKTRSSRIWWPANLSTTM